MVQRVVDQTWHKFIFEAVGLNDGPLVDTVGDEPSYFVDLINLRSIS